MPLTATQIGKLPATHMPIRLEIASRVLCCFYAGSGLSSEACVNEALSVADVLIKRYVETETDNA